MSFRRAANTKQIPFSFPMLFWLLRCTCCCYLHPTEDVVFYVFSVEFLFKLQNIFACLKSVEKFGPYTLLRRTENLFSLEIV